MKMSKWRLYPIVGEIVNNKACITFEICIKCVPLHIQVDNDIKKPIQCAINGPTKIVIDLKRKGIFNITWYMNYSISFKHIINTNDVDKIVFLSCDFPEADVKVSMWDKINQSNNNIIVHLGDQIYGDKQYKAAKKIQKKYLQEHEKDDNMKFRYYNLYANRYCDTFNKRRSIMSNNSNYFLWDDHEIVNDIVFDNQHFQVDENFIMNEYCWYKYIGDILVLAVERTSEIITVEQIIDALEYLIYKVNKIILCFSCAIIPPPHGVSGSIYCAIKGTGKFYDTNNLKTLLDWLFKCGKEVILVGGDLHLGVLGYYQKDDKKIQVLIASPITNHPSVDRRLIARGLRGSINMDGIEFTVTSAKAKRCFGSVDMNTFTASITYSKCTYPHKLIKYIQY